MQDEIELRRSRPAELSTETLKNEAGIFRVKFQSCEDSFSGFLRGSQSGLFASVAPIGKVADELVIAAADSQSPPLK